jgi:hypothetical protein
MLIAATTTTTAAAAGDDNMTNVLLYQEEEAVVVERTPATADGLSLFSTAALLRQPPLILTVLPGQTLSEIMDAVVAAMRRGPVRVNFDGYSGNRNENFNRLRMYMLCYSNYDEE